MDQSYTPAVNPDTPISSSHYNYQSISQREAIFLRSKSLIKYFITFIAIIVAFYLGGVIGNAQPTNLGNGKLGTNTPWKIKRLLPGMIVSPQSGCKITGCGGNQCINSNLPDINESNCQPTRYACYKNAICQVQANGLCGWTETPEYQTCKAEQTDFGERTIDANQDLKDRGL